MAYDGHPGGFSWMFFIQWVLCDEAELVEVPVMVASHTLSIRWLSGKEKRDKCTSLVRRWGSSHRRWRLLVALTESILAHVNKVLYVLYFCRAAGAVCRKQCHECNLPTPWKLTCLSICHWVPSSCALHLACWIISFQSAFLRNSRDA